MYGRNEMMTDARYAAMHLCTLITLLSMMRLKALSSQWMMFACANIYIKCVRHDDSGDTAIDDANGINKSKASTDAVIMYSLFMIASLRFNVVLVNIQSSAEIPLQRFRTETYEWGRLFESKIHDVRHGMPCIFPFA